MGRSGRGGGSGGSVVGVVNDLEWLRGVLPGGGHEPGRTPDTPWTLAHPCNAYTFPRRLTSDAGPSQSSHQKLAMPFPRFQPPAHRIYSTTHTPRHYIHFVSLWLIIVQPVIHPAYLLRTFVIFLPCQSGLAASITSAHQCATFATYQCQPPTVFRMRGDPADPAHKMHP